MGAGLRPEAKATESPPDPNVGAPVLDSTDTILFMDVNLGKADLSSLSPALRALFEGQQAAIEASRAENASLSDRNQHLEDQNRRLEHLLWEMRRAVYGKKSEKLDPGQLQLAFEDLEAALAEAEESRQAPAAAAPRRKRPAPERNIGHLPAHLPRSERVIEPASTQCPCGCGEMARIGEDRTERLDIVPAQLQVTVTVRPKHACRKCEEGVTQAETPARLIEGALPTEGAIAHVLVSKYADHCVSRSTTMEVRNCKRDQGRPLGVDDQASISNHHELLS